MKKNVLSLLATFQLFFGVNLSAQNSYSFSELKNNTYTDLSGDIAVTVFNGASLFNVPSVNGEVFLFYDLPFTIGGLKTFAMGDAPFVRIDNDSSAVIIDAAFSYVDSIDPSSKKSYLVQGLSGDKILKFQYKNLKLTYGQAGNFINVQVWYYQKTGVIEIHYGPRSANNASGFTTASGPNIGIFYAPDTFTSCYEKLWVKGTPTNPVLDSASTLAFAAMKGVPVEGTIYRFTPRFIEQPPVNTTSLREFSLFETLKIYPNPASDKITIAINTKLNEFFLFDRDGKLLIHKEKISPGKFELNISALPPGVYFVKTIAAQAVYTGKFIKD